MVFATVEKSAFRDRSELKGKILFLRDVGLKQVGYYSFLEKNVSSVFSFNAKIKNKIT